MKTVNINQVNLESCVDEAQRGGVLVTRNGATARRRHWCWGSREWTKSKLNWA